MDLQSKMIELSEYSFGCRVIDGMFLVNIRFKDGWKVIPPEDDSIEFGDKTGITYYCSEVNNDKLEKIFTSINETIEYNKDLEKKLVLFRSKVAELQEVFAEEDLATLETITFKYKKRRGRPKTESNTEEFVKEEPAEENLLEEVSETGGIENVQNENVVEAEFTIIER